MSRALDSHLGRRSVARGAPSANVWRRVGRRTLHVLMALLAIGLALVVAGAIYVATLRSVADAPARVQQILTAHHGTYGRPPVPAKLGAALVAVEDEHFYDNFLVNVVTGVGRAAVATFDNQSDPGGSTIQQQLAKLLYGSGTSWSATLREIGLGIRLSLDYSKAQILDMYLNAAYFGSGYWGYVAAARGYFHTSPGNLDWAQAALLAGLPQAPSAYDPRHDLTLAKQRQRHVLNQLVVNHYLTAAEANAAFRDPLGFG